MKKTIILSGLLAMALSSSAAVNFSEAEELALPQSILNPVLSPDGKYVLFSSSNHDGLSMLDLAKGTISVVDDAPGAGFNPVFTSDSKSIVYRTVSRRDGLTELDARRFDIAGNVGEKIAGFSRNSEDAVTLSGREKYALADYRSIRLVDNGIAREISPLSDAHSYLWASLSPDGSRLLFCEPFKGVFVAEADGSNPVKIAAKGDFPAWVDNNTVVYVLSHDDGYVVLDAALMACDLSDMSTTAVTDKEARIGELSAAAGSVVYTTLDGKTFRITLKR